MRNDNDTKNASNADITGQEVTSDTANQSSPSQTPNLNTLAENKAIDTKQGGLSQGGASETTPNVENTTSTIPPQRTPFNTSDAKNEPAPDFSKISNEALSTESISSTPLPPTPPINTSPPPQPGTQISPNTVTNDGGKRRSKFAVVAGILILAILIIWAIVAYIYFQNRALENATEDTNETSTLTMVPEPTVAFDPKSITISNGNIIQSNASKGGEDIILIDKGNFVEDAGITGFSNVTVSPDNSKMCFVSFPPAVNPSVYIANIDGTDATKVSEGKTGCLWDNTSSKIYYTDLSENSQGGVDIYEYSLTSLEEENITEMLTDAASPSPAVLDPRIYSIVGLSPDGKYLNCNFKTSADQEEAVSCQIDLVSYEILTSETPEN